MDSILGEDQASSRPYLDQPPPSHGPEPPQQSRGSTHGGCGGAYPERARGHRRGVSADEPNQPCPGARGQSRQGGCVGGGAGGRHPGGQAHRRIDSPLPSDPAHLPGGGD